MVKSLEEKLKQKPFERVGEYTLAEEYLMKSKREYKNGNYDKAKEYCQESLKLEDNIAETHNLFGIIFGQQEDYKTAKTHLEKATQLKPNDPILHYNLAATLEKEGLEPNRSIAEYECAIRLKPNFIDAHGRLAAVYLTQLKDPKKAEGHYLNARELKIEERLMQKHIQKVEKGEILPDIPPEGRIVGVCFDHCFTTPLEILEEGLELAFEESEKIYENAKTTEKEDEKLQLAEQSATDLMAGLSLAFKIAKRRGLV